jgi:predicted nucleic acid-binding protein
MYLIDTNVISELRKAKPHGGVVAWMQSVRDTDLFISAVTLGEIQRGIEITQAQNAEKARQITQWADRLSLAHHILPMDAQTFRVWARLMHRQSDALYEDAMIAATAQVHQLTVVTRNVRDFSSFNVPLLNPFEATP